MIAALVLASLVSPWIGRVSQAAAPSLELIENAGQWDERVRFAGKLQGASVVVERDAIVLTVRGETAAPPVTLRFEGASASAEPQGFAPRSGVYHFFLGDDPAHWRRDVRTWSGVRWRGLYPGVDLELYAMEGGLKYDLRLEPNADLSAIVVRCEGNGDLVTLDDTTIAVASSGIALLHGGGLSWEVLPDGSKRPVTCTTRTLDGNGIGFDVADRRPEHPLVIDPALYWSTYLGSASQSIGDLAFAAAVDKQGDITVVGFTDGDDFPSTRGYQHPGQNVVWAGDTFVTRLRGSDGTLIWSSVIGGSHHQERAMAVAIDEVGRPTVGGWTDSTDFPTTPGAFQTRKTSTGSTAYVLRLSGDGGDLEYSTFIESLWHTEVCAVALDLRTGAAIVGGQVTVGGLAVTPGVFQDTLPGNGSAYIARVAPDGGRLEWATYFGGAEDIESVAAIALGPDGAITFAGNAPSGDLPTTPGAFDRELGGTLDGYVARLDATGRELLWSTYLGGDGGDEAHDLFVTPDGETYVAGRSGSLDFPTTPGAYQGNGMFGGFVIRFGADGQLLHSTYFAGPDSERIYEIAVDASGVPTVAGDVLGLVPITPGAHDETWAGGPRDFFIARFDPALSKLLYSTFVGGPRDDFCTSLAMTPSGRATVAGHTLGAGYPTTPGTHSPDYNGGQADAVVTTLDLFLRGVEPFGESVPSCLGPLQLNATEMPTAGSTTFSLWVSGAPPLSRGWLFVAGADGQPGFTGQALQSAGLLVRPESVVGVESDSKGWLEVPLSLTTVRSGDRVAAQVLFRHAAHCSAAGPWALSNAVVVTAQ